MIIKVYRKKIEKKLKFFLKNWRSLAATHLVPNPFGPRTSGPPLPVPLDKWSPKIRSPWTNGPQPIWSPWTNGPHQIWSPRTNGPQKFGPPGQMVPRIFRLSMETGCGDLEIRGPNWFGLVVQGFNFIRDHLLRGTESGGPEVRD